MFERWQAEAQPVTGQRHVETQGTSAGEACLELVSVSKRIGERDVLRDVSLHVARHEVVGLLGRDGAGKTVCFETILGLLEPSSGRILLDGVEIGGLPTYRRAMLGLAYLPQEPSIFRGLTVEQNIDAILELWEPDSAARETRLDQILAEFNLTPLRTRSPPTLSGGERRRCEFARAMAGQPSIILLDEPFAGIDPLSLGGIEGAIRRIRHEGVGVLITDYHMHEVLEVIDRAYVLHEGEVIFSGDPQRLMSDEKVRRAFLGDQYED